MTLRLRASKEWDSLANPVSFIVNEKRKRQRDSKNTYRNGKLLETRHGFSRFNSTAISDTPLSCSFFEDSSGNYYRLVKSGTSLYKINTSGSHTAIKTGLNSSTKHIGETFRDTHAIAIGSDGLFQYDGTNFTQIGQAPPSAPTVALSGSGNTLPQNIFTAAYTFYSSNTGFESNIGASSSQVTITATLEQIDLTGLATSADNSTVDKKRIYLKNVTNASEWLFVAEISLATASYSISAPTTSTNTPPVKNATPPSGGWKYLCEFGAAMAIAGSPVFPNQVSLSEDNLIDAWDDTATQKTFYVNGNGIITGIAQGLFDDTDLLPYLVILKEGSISIYTSANGPVLISKEIGCVNSNTIHVKNGIVYFMSQLGWLRVYNGRIEKNRGGNLKTLGDGDIDQIFTLQGYTYEINKNDYSNFHSCYYRDLDHYMTFVSEGSNNAINKSYVYDHEQDGFYIFTFKINIRCSMAGRDSSGRPCILLVDSDGFMYSYSIYESRTDKDKDNANVKIQALSISTWIDGTSDMSAKYKFKKLFVRALSSENTINVLSWIKYDVSAQQTNSFSFPSNSSGFILDLSKLDEGVLSDDREIIKAQKDINRKGESLSLAFYQEVENGNMALIEAQLDFRKIRNGI
jgi:hypothetical protein